MHTSCSIKVSKDSTYIIMKQTGYINKNLGVAYNIEAHKLAGNLRINKFLVDLTETKNMDTFVEKYEFAYKDLQNLPEIFKKEIIAMVVAPRDHSHDFVEKISRKIGFNVTIFRDIHAAEEYIKNAVFEEKAVSDNSSEENQIFFPAYDTDKENIEYACPMCGSIDFIFDPERSDNSIICPECGISYNEKELSEINRDNISFITSNIFDDQLEDLPPYLESDCI